MTKKEIAKDFFTKVVLPVFITGFLFAVSGMILRDAEKIIPPFYYFQIRWMICGIPFGIQRMRLWLIPRGGDMTFSVGVWGINIFVGALIGGFVLIWKLLCAVWYLILTIYRIITYKRISQT